MKLQVICWHCSEKEMKLLKSVGFEHNIGIIDVPSIEETILKIFGTGLNVMIAHLKSDPDTVLLGVADDLFRQR